MNTPQDAIKQLDTLLEEYHRVEAMAAGFGELKSNALVTRMHSAIQRLTIPASAYRVEATELRQRFMPDYQLSRLAAIVQALRDDLQAGWLESIVELVHADTHKGYLEMAEELLDKNYKDAAAVIAGSSLEVHIRALCVKHGVATNDGGKPKKADTMNADLKRESVYGGLEQKQVTSWLALRNLAAHGQYGDYVESDVRGLIDGIQAFAIKYPA
ncbi:hypothetical protein ACIRSS_50090 [Amycolatopsis sp. NPDC101161]|uniref:hypothetical protein n=1 Tax=Amycolatopsis sp. NPDC101161 TaxID=3363940 RepID=UPI00380350AD